MGTRGCVGFRINKKDKLTYNHFDSYPTELGKNVMLFIKDTPDIEIKEIAARIILVKDDVPPTDEQIKECRGFANLSVGNKTEKEWYSLLREAQGKLEAYKSKPIVVDVNDPDIFKTPTQDEKEDATVTGLKYMVDSHYFMKESLFCEWAYVLNTDKNELEIYRGFNKKKNGKGRYAKGKADDGGYYGVTLLETISFQDVRDIEGKEGILEYCNKLEKKAG